MKKIITLIFGVEIFNLFIFKKLIEIDENQTSAINNLIEILDKSKSKLSKKERIKLLNEILGEENENKK